MADASPGAIPVGPWLDRRRFATAAPGVFPFSVSVLSWAYNEEENIQDFLVRAKALLDSLGVEYEHILIDDCSRDRTVEIAEGMKARYPQLRIHRNEKNMDSGWNTRIAVKLATKDVLFWQTVDWSYDISKIGGYLWHLRDHDVVQCVRIERKAPEYGKVLSKLLAIPRVKVRKRSDNFSKAIVSVVNYSLIRILFRIPLLDFQNVTIYPRALAQSLELETHSSFTNPEMLIKAYWKGASFAQVPIDFLPRQRGVAKGTRWRAVVASVRQLFHYWYRWQVLGQGLGMDRSQKRKGHVSPPEPG